MLINKINTSNDSNENSKTAFGILKIKTKGFNADELRAINNSYNTLEENAKDVFQVIQKGRKIIYYLDTGRNSRLVKDNWFNRLKFHGIRTTKPIYLVTTSKLNKSLPDKIAYILNFNTHRIKTFSKSTEDLDLKDLSTTLKETANKSKTDFLTQNRDIVLSELYIKMNAKRYPKILRFKTRANQ